MRKNLPDGRQLILQVLLQPFGEYLGLNNTLELTFREPTLGQERFVGRLVYLIFVWKELVLDLLSDIGIGDGCRTSSAVSRTTRGASLLSPLGL